MRARRARRARPLGRPLRARRRTCRAEATERPAATGRPWSRTRAAAPRSRRPIGASRRRRRRRGPLPARRLRWADQSLRTRPIEPGPPWARLDALLGLSPYGAVGGRLRSTRTALDAAA